MHRSRRPRLNGTPLVGWIQSGAMEDVIGGDPVKLGYLTVWAAHHLLTGHRFKRGVYRLREWGLRVSYFPEHRELRLGRPLTITKANLAAYLGCELAVRDRGWGRCGGVRRTRPAASVDQHPGNLKLAMRVCQPAVEEAWPAAV